MSKTEKGMYSVPFQKRRKQLATIQAAKGLTKTDSVTGQVTLPTIEELSQSMGETYGCIYARVSKLRKLGINIVRIVEDDEKLQRSLKSRRNSGR